MRLSVIPLLFACGIESGLKGFSDNNGAGDSDSGYDPDPDDTDDGLCADPDLDLPGVSVDESCEAEAIVGTFTPVQEWVNQGIGDAYATPVVGRIVDTNGDGTLSSADMPVVIVANSAGQMVAMAGDTGLEIWRAGNFGSEPMTPAIGDLDGDGWPEVVGAGVSGTAAFRGRDGSPYWNTRAYVGGKQPQCGAVGIYDLDADGTPEVIIGGQVINGTTGATISQGVGDGSGNYGYSPFGVAADINQDGQLEVVVGNALYAKDGTRIWGNGQSDGFVAVANFDSDAYGEIVVSNQGSVRLQDDNGAVLWNRNGVTGSTSGSPTVADFDGDGEPEVGVAGNNVYMVFETDGSTKWSIRVQDVSSGFTGSSVFDFEGDGAAEVVYADENDVYVLDGSTGATKLRETQHSSATCSEYPAVADVDNDGHAEIIYTSSAYSGTERGVRVIGDADDSWMPSRAVWNQHAYAITNVNDDVSIPAPETTNWLSYNNFRSGDLAAATGGALSDAVPLEGEICTEECSSGTVRIIVGVGDQGMSDLPAGLAVSAYAITDGAPIYLSTQTVTDTIASGSSSPGLVFEFATSDLPFGAVSFTVDDNAGVGAVPECNEDNNTLVISEGLCD